MDEATKSIPESAMWVADSGVFIACGRQEQNKYTALERFAQRNEITFVIPNRVYEELGGAPDRSTPGQTPINSAIDNGWVTVADELDYTNPTVARVMDHVRGFIARKSNRSEDDIEKADTALGGVAAHLLDSGKATRSASSRQMTMLGTVSSLQSKLRDTMIKSHSKMGLI